MIFYERKLTHIKNMSCPLHSEFRCKYCGKLLFKGFLIDGEIEVKCKNCHEMTVLKNSSENEYICMKKGCPHRVGFCSQKPLPIARQKMSFKGKVIN